MAHVSGIAGYAAKTALGTWRVAEGHGGGVATAFASGLVIAIGAENLLFLKLLIAAITLDMVMGIGRAIRDPEDQIDRSKLWGGVLGKLMRLGYIPLASVIDWTIVGLSPDGAREALTQTMIVTKGALVWLIIAECVSIGENIAAGDGSTAGLWAYLRAFLERLRPEPPQGGPKQGGER